MVGRRLTDHLKLRLESVWILIIKHQWRLLRVSGHLRREGGGRRGGGRHLDEVRRGVDDRRVSHLQTGVLTVVDGVTRGVESTEGLYKTTGRNGNIRVKSF